MVTGRSSVASGAPCLSERPRVLSCSADRVGSLRSVRRLFTSIRDNRAAVVLAARSRVALSNSVTREEAAARPTASPPRSTPPRRLIDPSIGPVEDLPNGLPSAMVTGCLDENSYTILLLVQRYFLFASCAGDAVLSCLFWTVRMGTVACLHFLVGSRTSSVMVRDDSDERAIDGVSGCSLLAAFASSSDLGYLYHLLCLRL